MIMKNINYIQSKKGIFKNFSQRFTLGCLAVTSCFLSSVAQAANPDTNWSTTSTMTDCYGLEDESYGEAQSETSCQNYDEDLYENWDPNGDLNGDDTDIKTFSVGADNTYFYFEIDLRENWTSESRKYYLEIEADGDGQSDYFLVYQPKSDDLGSSWKNIGGNGEIEVYEDYNNSIGGSNLTGADGGDSDGYEAEVSPNKNLTPNDFFVRLVNGNVQMALKKNRIGDPSNILSRAYASQNTNLSNNSLTWHDWYYSGTLNGNGFDSSAGADTSTWLELNSPSSSNITGHLTADNHYGLFTGNDNGSDLTFVGRNEYGPDGNPGEFNWSIGEEWNFFLDDDDYIYIVAWDDANIDESWIGQFILNSGETLLSVEGSWEYIIASGSNPGDYGEVPSNSELQSEISSANWQSVNSRGDNGMSPWGTIAGISSDADFLNTTTPSNGNYTIFRTKFAVKPELTNPPSSSTNQPPDAVNDSVLAYFQTLTLDVLANDTDPDLASNPDEIITVIDVPHVTGGTCIINNDGMIVYTPTNGPGTYTLEYTISDNSGATDTATVTIELLLGD